MLLGIATSNIANPEKRGFRDRLYLAESWNTGEECRGALQVVDLSNAGDPVRLGGYDTLGWIHAVAVSGNHAYIVLDVNSCSRKGNPAEEPEYRLQILDIADPANPQLAGECRVDATGTGLALSGGHAYITGGNRMQVIDVSDPSDPKLVGSHETAHETRGVAISENLAYVGERFAGLLVIDVADPADPRLIGTGAGEVFWHPSGVVLDGAYAYVSATTEGEGGVEEFVLFDIRDPANPHRVGGFDSTSGYADDVAVSGSLAFLADEAGGLKIIDVSDPAQPRLAGVFLGHPSNRNPYATDVAVSGKYAYLVDRAGLLVIEFHAPANPRRIGGFHTSKRVFGAAASDDVAYLEGWRHDEIGRMSALSVVDVRDPANPRLVGVYDRSEWTYRLPVSSNFEYVPDPDELWIVRDVSDPANPRILGGYKTIAAASGVALSGNFAYVAGWNTSEGRAPRVRK